MKMPAVALRGMTILPDMIIDFDLNRKKSMAAIEKAMIEERKVFLVTQKDEQIEEPDFQQVFHVGTIALVKQVNKLTDNVQRVMVEGISRGILHGFEELQEDYLWAEVEEMEHCDGQLEPMVEEAMLREIQDLFVQYAQYYPKIGKTLASHVREISNLESLIDRITMAMPLRYTGKQNILEAKRLSKRYDFLAKILLNEIEIAKVRSKLSEDIRKRVEKNQKEYLLREQLSYIKEELGEGNTYSDADHFEEEVKKLKASQNVKERIKKEITKLRSLSFSSSESAVEGAYIETLLEMPWDKKSQDNLDLAHAEVVLNQQHYGMEQVKERIFEFLAVRSLTKQTESPIICLVGPPGTGKTSIVKSVAEALNRKYVRICLGGIRDEAEIRGHRKTYVGAMPGRIANALKQAEVKNPVILLDEIDKLSQDNKGDPSSALLEVLDSEQNHKFRDHYIQIPIDLSEAFFIATANTVSGIPRPLLDRMEVIEVASYTENEKFHIAKKYLLAKQAERNGLGKRPFTISDGALKNMIQLYTRETGVRELERKIGEVCRKAAREILLKEQKKQQIKGENQGKKEEKAGIKVTVNNLEKYLGKEKYSRDKANSADEIGIVRGLAWTSFGGDTLQIEVNMMPGKGEVELTGQMGDVMKESALTGMSYVRSISKEYGIPADCFRKHDFHIHIPEGAIPKDGPSAGITMAAALVSVITGIPVYAHVAMTGEITLRGRVLPVGGLKEKILAAKNAGIKTVLIPKENQKDMEYISTEIKENMEILLVENMKEVLNRALVGR